MLNTPLHNNEDNILERLKHPEREAERHKRNKMFVIRNVLNCIFIVLALITMLGIGLSLISHNTETFNSLSYSKFFGNTMTWYMLGLVAVVIKMIEVVLRMPGIKK